MTARVRSHSSANARGSAAARRARKAWLLRTFAPHVSEAIAFCTLALAEGCLGLVDEATVSPERILPGRDGGTYRRENIRPACVPCQVAQGYALGIGAARLS